MVLNALLAVQVAATTSLGFVSGLLVHSMSKIADVGLGYEVGSSFMVPLVFSNKDYPTSAHQSQFFDQALVRVRNLPGVASAGISAAPPLSNMTVTTGGEGAAFESPGRPPEALAPFVVQFVSPGYFEALGVRPIRGRLFSQDDRRSAAPVAIVDQGFWDARRVRADPLKAGIRYGRPLLQIVGVVGNMRQSGPTERAVPTVYLLSSQRPGAGRFGFLVVRPSGRPQAAMDAVVRELARLDSRVCVDEPRTLQSLVAGTVATRHRAMRLLTLSAVVVLLLTIFSLSGSLGQYVENQKHDIAIRKAFGASSSRTALLLFEQVGGPCLAGLLIGCGAAWMLARTMAAQLFGVGTADPWTVVTTVTVMTASGVLAASVPLVRAGRIDPAHVLRGL